LVWVELTLVTAQGTLSMMTTTLFTFPFVKVPVILTAVPPAEVP
jgi:hypothetical protein